MRIDDFYSPIWDPARRNLPERVYEDEDVILASNFECGNGFRFHKPAEGRYRFELEPEPGNHDFSGKAYYFCFVALNKHGTPRHITVEVANPIFHEASWAEATRFVIVRRGDSWHHLPQKNMLTSPHDGIIAFEAMLPPASGENPLLFFSNYHWYPWSEMTADLKQLQKRKKDVRLCAIGKSAEGRDIWAVEVGRDEENAPTIVCAATPQPNEMGHHACRGILDFLLTDNGAARDICERHRICLIPHPNPDGSVMGYMASDAAGNFPYFMGKEAIEGSVGAPIEQVAIWDYIRRKHPWIYFEWHSNHMHRRKGHMLLRYDPNLAADESVRRIWDGFDRRLAALPDAHPENLTDLTNGYTNSIGLGVVAKLGGIAVMPKVHEKYPLERILDWVVNAFRSATDAYAECMTGSDSQSVTSTTVQQNTGSDY